MTLSGGERKRRRDATEKLNPLIVIQVTMIEIMKMLCQKQNRAIALEKIFVTKARQ